ncbi:MAG: DUF2330 domain-containing protein [Alphaproteobacteria bacterium]|nr:DUF2330 domain-containing protein [Alphaproteobacteria bacterium]
MLSLLLLAQAAPSYAFCGNYVGQAGAELTNAASRVAIVRQDDRTTLTMANDFDANVSEFAVVVPVPVVLTEADVRVVDPAVFDTLDLYSGPRLVSYTCEELYPEVSRGGCNPFVSYDIAIKTDEAGGGLSDPFSDVDVEERFIVGEYEVVVLSAEESSSLLGWLDANGYAVSAEAEDLFQEYIDSGSYFFAAKVFLERLPPGQDWLSPLQFTYTSDVFALPIRPGTINSPGSQDLVIYAITNPSDGQVRISNYPQTTIEDECLFEDDPEAFGDFYEGQFDDGVAQVEDDASWAIEYGWSVSPWVAACDPCPPTETAEPMPSADLVALGYDPNPEGEDDSGVYVEGLSYYFTRLRMRYTPAQADEDLLFYLSGETENTQQRYVQHASFLEDLYPICGFGFVEDPGSCKDEGMEMRRRVRQAEREEGGEGGCASWAWGGLSYGAVALVGLLIAGRRRRQR